MGTVMANQGGDHASALEALQPYGEWGGMLRLDVYRQATGQPWAGSPVMRWSAWLMVSRMSRTRCPSWRE